MSGQYVMIKFDGLKAVHAMVWQLRTSMSVRLWNNGAYSVFAPHTTHGVGQSLADIPEADLVAVMEADGQFRHIWKYAPVSETDAVILESVVFDVTDRTRVINVRLPLAVFVSKITFVFGEDNLGDSLYMDVASLTVVGTVSADISAAETVIPLSESAAHTFFRGSSLDLDNTRYTVTSVDIWGGKLRISPPLQANVDEGTVVGFSIPVVKGLVIAKTGDYVIDVGNRFLPQSCPITLVYTNTSEAKKRCYMNIEYTT